MSNCDDDYNDVGVLLCWAYVTAMLLCTLFSHCVAFLWLYDHVHNILTYYILIYSLFVQSEENVLTSYALIIRCVCCFVVAYEFQMNIAWTLTHQND